MLERYGGIYLFRPMHITLILLAQGWEILTDAVIHWINKNLRGVAFLLWGSYAQKKGAFIDKVRGLVLTSPYSLFLLLFH